MRRRRRARGVVRVLLVVAWADVGLWYASSTEGAGVFLLGGSWDWAEFLVRFALAAVGVQVAWWVGSRLGRRFLPVHPDRRRQDDALDLTVGSLWTGMLPTELDPATWSAALDVVRRELRAALVGFVLPGALTLGLVVGAAVRTGPGAAGIWALAVGVVVLGSPPALAVVRLLRNRRRLSAEVDRRVVTGEASDHRER